MALNYLIILISKGSTMLVNIELEEIPNNMICTLCMQGYDSSVGIPQFTQILLLQLLKEGLSSVSIRLWSYTSERQ